MLTNVTLQDRLFVALQELEGIASEYAFDGAGLVQGNDAPPPSIRRAIMSARRLLSEAKATVYVSQP